MEKLAGYVEHIIYRNTDNGYTVLNLVSGEDEITCVGIFSTIAEGENIEAAGDYTDHPTYGTQFKVVSFEEKAPEDQEAIERYLGSGAIKGIGLAMAARIVRRFREDTFRIIEEEPERLAEVKGISERKAMEIASQVNEKRDLRHHLIALAGEVVAGGGEGQPHLSVSGPQPPGHLHACGAAHVDIQHHQLEGAGPPVRQQRFPAAVVGDLRLPAQLLGEILLQLRQSPGIIIHQCDLHRQCSSLHDTISIILRTGRKNKKNDMPCPKLKIFLKPSRFLHWDVV